MGVKVAELFHLRSTTPYTTAPSELSLGVSDGQQKT